ncbi:uncharacterized protein LOC134183298 [Corticium candelabrum]|uniref:uncharacterized protein LOC134183298 n=1 Tax=Corticium candelabrum TaxID=121492 RepID=UPI002E26254F|nr:uncharacterized protein LOC134183298 [Corticium candelabrum]
MDLADEQTREVIRQAFQRNQRCEGGSDDYLTATELQQALLELGTKVDDDDAQILVEENSPQTRRIPLKAFTLIALEKCRFASKGQRSRVRKVSAVKIKETFGQFDHNQTGQINSSEAKGALNKLGINFPAHIVDKMMEQADQDGDGKITLQEFESLMSDS